MLLVLFAQSLMVEEVQSKWTESCSFDEFCLWWKKHRRLLESGTSCFIFAGDDNDQVSHINLKLRMMVAYATIVILSYSDVLLALCL